MFVGAQNLRAYVFRSVKLSRLRVQERKPGAVFRSGEDAHLCRCVQTCARRRKRAQERRFDAEIKSIFWASPLTSLVKHGPDGFLSLPVFSIYSSTRDTVHFI